MKGGLPVSGAQAPGLSCRAQQLLPKQSVPSLPLKTFAFGLVCLFEGPWEIDSATLIDILSWFMSLRHVLHGVPPCLQSTVGVFAPQPRFSSLLTALTYLKCVFLLLATRECHLLKGGRFFL